MISKARKISGAVSHVVALALGENQSIIAQRIISSSQARPPKNMYRTKLETQKLSLIGIDHPIMLMFNDVLPEAFIMMSVHTCSDKGMQVR